MMLGALVMTALEVDMVAQIILILVTLTITLATIVVDMTHIALTDTLTITRIDMMAVKNAKVKARIIRMMVKAITKM